MAVLTRNRVLAVVVAAAALAGAGVAALGGGDPGSSGSFWESVRSSGGALAFTYDSVPSIVADSHVVVLGRVAAVAPGRPFAGIEGDRVVEETAAAARSTLLSITVEEILAGDKSLVTDGRIDNIEVMPLEAHNDDALPSGRAVFFLIAQDRAASAAGEPPAAVDRGREFFALTHPHGAQIERDGRVEPAFERGGHHDGAGQRMTRARTLAELANEVRAATQNTGPDSGR